MRIQVRSPGANFSLRLPTGLALNRVTAWFAPKIMAQNGISISPQASVRLVTELNRYRKSHPEWCLVEVESADGETVKIKL